MPSEGNQNRSKLEVSESLDVPQDLENILGNKEKENHNRQKMAKDSDIQANNHNDKANQISNARQTLESMDGQPTTPGNERKVREARKALGEVANDLLDETKKDVKDGQEKDVIINDQVADGRLNLNDVEKRIVEYENHQRAELHHAIENRLSTKLIPALAAYDVNSLSDLQIAMNCDSQADLINSCENILKAASPHTERDFKTSDIHDSIGNLDELEKILIAGFRLQKEDDGFRLEQFRIDPEAALKAIRVEREIEGMSEEEDTLAD
jgi:hypothetical protein